MLLSKPSDVRYLKHQYYNLVDEAYILFVLESLLKHFQCKWTPRLDTLKFHIYGLRIPGNNKIFEKIIRQN